MCSVRMLCFYPFLALSINVKAVLSQQNQQMIQPNQQNPESYQGMIPYALYKSHKHTRQQIQTQREQAQHTISFLEREAKKTARELEQKQKSLVNYYNLKESRLLESQKKSTLRRKREESLDQLRKTNSQLREQSALKRTLAKEQLMRQNQRFAQGIKSSRVESERRLSEQKMLENQLLRKRNSAFSKALALGAEHSKVKSQVDKRHKSSAVKNDLIYVQERIKNREAQKIAVLSVRQQELLSIVEKNRREKSHYDETLQQFQTLPFEQVYPSIEKPGKSKRAASRRSSLRSESLFV